MEGLGKNEGTVSGDLLNLSGQNLKPAFIESLSLEDLTFMHSALALKSHPEKGMALMVDENQSIIMSLAQKGLNETPVLDDRTEPLRKFMGRL